MLKSPLRAMVQRIYIRNTFHDLFSIYSRPTQFPDLRLRRDTFVLRAQQRQSGLSPCVYCSIQQICRRVCYIIDWWVGGWLEYYIIMGFICLRPLKQIYQLCTYLFRIVLSELVHFGDDPFQSL